MAVPTFTPPQNPNVDYGHDTEANVLEVKFGDNYTQRTGNGLNTMQRVLQLQWGPITPANADALEAFFRSQGGWAPFMYQTPLDFLRGQPARRYVCKKWNRRTAQINAEHVSAVFEEDFGLGG